METIKAINMWLLLHSLIVVFPRRIAHWANHTVNERVDMFNEKITEENVEKALELLTALGIFDKKYRFETSSGQLLSENYNSPEDVPEELEDSFGDPILRRSGDIVTVFILKQGRSVGEIFNENLEIDIEKIEAVRTMPQIDQTFLDRLLKSS